MISRPREATTSSLLYLEAKNNSLASKKNVHCKKMLAIFPPPAGMSLTKLCLVGIN